MNQVTDDMSYREAYKDKRYDLLFCDLETTGLDSKKHEVIEICAKLLSKDGLQLGPVFYRKMYPSGEVDPRAAAVNGYTPEKWIDAISAPIAWAQFNSWLEGRSVQLVNWNPGFDFRFLTPQVLSFKMSYHPLDMLSMVWPYVCRVEPEEGRKYVTLAQAARRCLGRTYAAHTAQGDVDMCIDLYKWVILKGW